MVTLLGKICRSAGESPVKIVHEVRQLNYRERIAVTELPTMEERWKRAHKITTFNILNRSEILVLTSSSKVAEVDQERNIEFLE